MNLKQRIENAIPHDKLLHFTIGLLLALPAFVWFGFILLPVIVGLLAELYDRYVRKTKFDWLDWVATSLSTIPVCIIYYVNV